MNFSRYQFLSADAIAAAVDEVAKEYDNKSHCPPWLSNIFERAVEIQHEIDH